MRFFGKCFLMIFVKQCLLDGKLVVKSIDLKGILGEGRHPTTFCWCVPFGEKNSWKGYTLESSRVGTQKMEVWFR